MLSPEYPNEDFSNRFRSKKDFDSFFNQVSTINRHNLQRILFTTNDRLESERLEKVGSNVVYGTLAIALPTAIFTWKIPFLNRVKRRIPKYCMKFLILFIPMSLAGSYVQATFVQFHERMHQKYFNQFDRYKNTGDIKELNPNVKSLF